MTWSMGTFDAVMREAGDDLVDAVVTVRRGEAAKLLAVLRMVDAYPAPESLELPASERVVPVGAAGAGVVGEYVALEVSTLLGVSVPVASNLIRDAANLRSRHPRLWGRVIGLQVEVWQAREVARACHELSADAAGWVDEHLDGVWGTVPWSRVRRRLNGLVVRADRELAARKAELGRRDRFVSIRHLGDSTSVLIAKIDTAAALRLGQLIARTVDRLAKDGHDESLPELRAQALEMLGTPQLLAADAEEAGPTAVMSDGQRPLADLVVHVGAEDLDPGATGTQVARVVACGGDVGPVLLSPGRASAGPPPREGHPCDRSGRRLSSRPVRDPDQDATAVDVARGLFGLPLLRQPVTLMRSGPLGSLPVLPPRREGSSGADPHLESRSAVEIRASRQDRRYVASGAACGRLVPVDLPIR